jgi:hypothetical protein
LYIAPCENEVVLYMSLEFVWPLTLCLYIALCENEVVLYMSLEFVELSTRRVVIFIHVCPVSLFHARLGMSVQYMA